MRKSYRVLTGVIAALGLGFAAVAVNAHPGFIGGGMAPCMTGGMGYGMMRGMGTHAMGPGYSGWMGGQQLMTPEEHAEHINRMRSAATPEERQKIAAATHAEMQKRATEKGITLPDMRGPHWGYGRNFKPTPQ